MRPAVVLLLWLSACGAPGAGGPGARPPGPVPGGGAPAPGSQPSAPLSSAEGERQSQSRRNMRIWGVVQRVRQGKHAALPPVTTAASGGVGDPLTEIRNGTALALTIWFAGKCGHKVEVPPQSQATAAFCAGTYNIAATVSDESFVPLLREQQVFEEGMRYQLDFFVKKSPR